MSLRLRLILLTVALVTVVVVVLSGLYLNSLVDSLSATALDRAQLASQQVNAYLNDRINRNSPESQTGNSQSKDKPAPASFDETKVLWREIVSSDPEVAAMLFRTLATLRTDIPLFKNVDELKWTGPTKAFKTLGERLDAAKTPEDERV